MGRARRNTPEMLKAQRSAGMKVRALVKAGLLPTPTKCEACGRTSGRRLHLHHWRGYDTESGADIDCVCLCDICHVRTHAGDIPEVRTGRVREDASDVVKLTLAIRVGIARAFIEGRLWLRGVPGSMFDRVIEEARAEGLGNVARGADRWNEERGIRATKQEMVDAAKWDVWHANLERARREGSIEAARAFALTGSLRLARRYLRRPIPKDQVRYALDHGLLARIDGRLTYTGPAFDGQPDPAHRRSA